MISLTKITHQLSCDGEGEAWTKLEKEKATMGAVHVTENLVNMLKSQMW